MLSSPSQSLTPWYPVAHRHCRGDTQALAGDPRGHVARRQVKRVSLDRPGTLGRGLRQEGRVCRDHPRPNPDKAGAALFPKSAPEEAAESPQTNRSQALVASRGQFNIQEVAAPQ